MSTKPLDDEIVFLIAAGRQWYTYLHYILDTKSTPIEFNAWSDNYSYLPVLGWDQPPASHLSLAEKMVDTNRYWIQRQDVSHFRALTTEEIGDKSLLHQVESLLSVMPDRGYATRAAEKQSSDAASGSLSSLSLTRNL